MRSIKFRGKARETKIWVYGSLLANTIGVPLIRDADNCYWYVIPDTVGEFTGAEDSDGNEIYEGDYLKIPIVSKKKQFLVTFDNGAFILPGSGEYLRFFASNKIDRYIVGNKYDSKPEEQYDS